MNPEAPEDVVTVTTQDGQPPNPYTRILEQYKALWENERPSLEVEFLANIYAGFEALMSAHTGQIQDKKSKAFRAEVEHINAFQAVLQNGMAEFVFLKDAPKYEAGADTLTFEQDMQRYAAQEQAKKILSAQQLKGTIRAYLDSRAEDVKKAPKTKSFIPGDKFLDTLEALRIAVDNELGGSFLRNAEPFHSPMMEMIAAAQVAYVDYLENLKLPAIDNDRPDPSAPEKARVPFQDQDDITANAQKPSKSVKPTESASADEVVALEDFDSAEEQLETVDKPAKRQATVPSSTAATLERERRLEKAQRIAGQENPVGHFAASFKWHIQEKADATQYPDTFMESHEQGRRLAATEDAKARAALETVLQDERNEAPARPAPQQAKLTSRVKTTLAHPHPQLDAANRQAELAQRLGSDHAKPYTGDEAKALAKKAKKDPSVLKSAEARQFVSVSKQVRQPSPKVATSIEKANAELSQYFPARRQRPSQTAQQPHVDQQTAALLTEAMAAHPKASADEKAASVSDASSTKSDDKSLISARLERPVHPPKGPALAHSQSRYDLVQKATIISEALKAGPQAMHYRSAYQATSQEAAHLSRTADELEAGLNRSHSSITRLQAEKAQLENQLQRMTFYKSAYETAQHDLEALESTLSERQEVFRSVDQKACRLEAELCEVRAQAEQSIEGMSADRKENDRLRARLAVATQELTELSRRADQNSGLKRRLQEMRRSLVSTRKEMNTLESQSAALSDRLHKLEAKDEKASAKIDHVSSELADRDARLASVQEMLAHTQAELHALQQEHAHCPEALQAQSAQHREKMKAALTKKAERLTKHFEQDKTAMKEKLGRKHREATRQLDAAHKELERHRKQRAK